jgi:hypothetical protein
MWVKYKTPKHQSTKAPKHLHQHLRGGVERVDAGEAPLCKLLPHLRIEPSGSGHATAFRVEAQREGDIGRARKREREREIERARERESEKGREKGGERKSERSVPDRCRHQRR